MPTNKSTVYINIYNYGAEPVKHVSTLKVSAGSVDHHWLCDDFSLQDYDVLENAILSAEALVGAKADLERIPSVVVRSNKTAHIENRLKPVCEAFVPYEVGSAISFNTDTPEHYVLRFFEDTVLEISDIYTGEIFRVSGDQDGAPA